MVPFRSRPFVALTVLAVVALSALPVPAADASGTSAMQIELRRADCFDTGMAVSPTPTLSSRERCILDVRTTTAISGGFDVALTFAWTDNGPDGVSVGFTQPVVSCPGTAGARCSETILEVTSSAATYAPDTQTFSVWATRLCGGAPCAPADEIRFDSQAIFLRASKTTIHCIPDPVPFETPSVCVIRVVDDGATGPASTPSSPAPAMWTQILPTQNGFRQPSDISTPCHLIAQVTPYTAECDFAIGKLGWSYRYAATYMASVRWDGDASHAGSGASVEIIPEPRSTVSDVTCADVYIGEIARCDMNVGDVDLPDAIAVEGNVSARSPVVSSGLRASYDWACELAAYAPPSFSVCTFTFAPFAAGAIPLEARYDPGFFPTHKSSTSSATVNVLKRPTVTAVSCGPGELAVGEPGACTVSVQDMHGFATPSGTVTLSVGGASPGLDAEPTVPTTGIDWSPAACTLVPTGADQRATCSVAFAPAAASGWPSPREIVVDAVYAGDGLHAVSDGSSLVKVSRRATSTLVGCTPDVRIPIEGPTPSATCDAVLADLSAGVAPALPSGWTNWSSGEVCADPAGPCSIAWVPVAIGHEWRWANYSGDVDHRPSGGADSVRVHAETRFAYTGALAVTSGAPLATRGVAASAIPACAASRPGSVLYMLDRDPLHGLPLATPIAIADLDASGASALHVSTSGWAPGSYVLTARLAETEACDESVDTAFLVVGAAGQVASGAGSTGASPAASSGDAQVAASPNAQQLSFSAQKRGGAYNGTFLLSSDAWRMRGTFTTLAKTSADGVTRCAADGVADLHVAVTDPATGRTTWVLATRGATLPFSLYLEDHGSAGGDAFGLHLGRIALPSDPPLPTGGAFAQALQNGDVTCR